MAPDTADLRNKMANLARPRESRGSSERCKRPPCDFWSMMDRFSHDLQDFLVRISVSFLFQLCACVCLFVHSFVCSVARSFFLSGVAKPTQAHHTLLLSYGVSKQQAKLIVSYARQRSKRSKFQTAEKSRGLFWFSRFSDQKLQRRNLFLKNNWRRHRRIDWWMDRHRAIDQSGSIDRRIADQLIDRS